MQRIVGERERGTVHGGRIRLLPPEINWAHRMLSASSLLCWSCTLAEVCSLRHIRCPSYGLWVATLRAESWALIRVLRSARLRHVSLTWLLSPLLARDTSDRPAVIFQPSDSYTCGAIPLEHRHVSSQLGPGGQWLQQWVGPTAPRRAASGQYARAPRIRPK